MQAKDAEPVGNAATKKALVARGKKSPAKKRARRA